MRNFDRTVNVLFLIKASIDYHTQVLCSVNIVNLRITNKKCE